MKSIFWVAAIACALGGVTASPAASLAKVRPESSVVSSNLARTLLGRQFAQIGPAPAMTAHMSAAAADAQAEPRRQPRALVDTGAGEISDRPSWFQTADKTGYGWRNGATETTFGLYRLPPTPDLPAPKISPEAKGAAGVSFTINLGNLGG